MGMLFHQSVLLEDEATYSRSHFKWIQNWCFLPCQPVQSNISATSFFLPYNNACPDEYGDISTKKYPSLPIINSLALIERKNFLFHKEDFGCFHFALEKWDEFIYTKHGEGRRIHFPILIKPQFKWRKAHFNLEKNDKLFKAPGRPFEYWENWLRTNRFNLVNDWNKKGIKKLDASSLF